MHVCSFPEKQNKQRQTMSDSAEENVDLMRQDVGRIHSTIIDHDENLNHSRGRLISVQRFASLINMTTTRLCSTFDANEGEGCEIESKWKLSVDSCCRWGTRNFPGWNATFLSFIKISLTPSLPLSSCWLSKYQLELTRKVSVSATS